MHIPSFIEKKRNGRELGADEIAEFIRGYTTGAVPDYQVSAWAMAVYFMGMTPTETGALTRAMMLSGGVLKHAPGSPPKVDKHSTGGIGDHVSLILAPLLACDDLWVPMISGRGLGITGGTLDKLESIPGFRVGLSEVEIAAQLARIGVAMVGQTANLCPADKKLYALRDVTATVPSIPLIVASIMSKKLAESLDRLVLDVKFGSGAFMTNREDAETLSTALCSVGRECGVQTHALLTPMDEPHGFAVGNALEVREAVEALQGRGEQDLVDLTLNLAERVANVPRTQLAQWLKDGTAWRKWVQLVEAQGGRAADTERILEIHAAPLQHPVLAKSDGQVMKMDAGLIGRACVALGGGRSMAADTIDHAVGFSGVAKVGSTVRAGDPLLIIHARDADRLAVAIDFVNRAIEIA
jgi:pyrimidine-nucleoside phosphorylase